MNSNFKHTVFALIVGAIMVSCGNSRGDSEQDSTLKTPFITEKGVDPFCLGASLYNIQPSGTYYDTIILKKYYTVLMGDHAVEVDENGLKEYYKMFSPDEYEEYVSVRRLGYVIKEHNPVIVFAYDKDAIIRKVQIITPELSLDNNIHVGMTASKLLNNYNAVMNIVCTSEFYENIITYKIADLHPNITLLSEYIYSTFSLRDDDGNELIPHQVKESEILGSILVSANVDEGECYYPLISQMVKGYEDEDEVIRGNSFDY